ncbi:LicD family protein [Paenibacillus agaridevorans]|uniref:LicD family protein n=1 Tax=Paenibacillus agaridevorans TaxID=171404 RepID=UPI0015E7EEFD|nr:LicD family protein [Paenibacillus agaridevorans]
MVKLDNETLRKLQLTQLEMLVEVDRICRKCGISYNIIAGTMLGAVRHQGYIPWDDDADVAMLRPEYTRFREACKTDLDTTRFYFQDHVSTKGYRWGYGKLRRKNTLFLREHQEHMPYEQGVFIDIFPMDGVPDNYMLRCLHNFVCFAIRKTLWSAVGRVADESAVKRLVYSLLYRIPERSLFSWYEKLIHTSNRKTTKLVRKLMFPTPNRVFGYYRKWYEQSEEYIFENKSFKGIKNYDEYLSFKFGEYMKLPPENMRKVHPVSQIKLIEGEGVYDQSS